LAVRPARATDAAAIAALYGHYVRTSTVTFELEAPDAAEIARRMDAVQASGMPYVVAEVGGVVAGFGYVGQFRPRAAYRFTCENTVYVAEGMQRMGVGGALLEELLAGARAAGARQMVAVIGGENPASVGLHARFGFEHVGVLRKVGWKFDQWLDVTLMQRAL
jgi:phosphinothricin acetyltransferase